jgi:CheY-like chemotaxis protein
MTDNVEMPGESQPHAPRIVLIVEDSENNAATLEMTALDIPGVAVRVVSCAHEALRILAATDPVRAVITDLNLPKMDGFELIERIRAHERRGRLPIIVVSGDPDPATPDRIERLGADAFFPKPFSPAAVRRKLEQLLNGESD